MSFDKIEFVKPNDILQGGFNPNLPAEITVTEQLLYSIANNLAILNNNLINSGALQNLALIGDLMQEIFTDDRIVDKKTSVLKTSENATYGSNRSVFVGEIASISIGAMYEISQSDMFRFIDDNMRTFWNTKNTGAIVNQAASTYSFNVPVPSVNVSSSPATVNVNASAPVVNNNVPVPSVSNTVEVAAAVPEITVNATAPIVNNIVDVPSVTNEVTVQSATPNIEVSSTAPIVNVSSSPATVNVSSTAPIVNNNIPVPNVTNEVTVQSATPNIEVSATAPIVNVSSSPAQIDYDDSSLINKINEVKEVLESSLIANFDNENEKGLANVLDDALMTEVDTNEKKGLSDIVFEKDIIINVDYPNEVVMESFDRKLK